MRALLAAVFLISLEANGLWCFGLGLLRNLLPPVALTDTWGPGSVFLSGFRHILHLPTLIPCLHVLGGHLAEFYSARWSETGDESV